MPRDVLKVAQASGPREDYQKVLDHFEDKGQKSRDEPGWYFLEGDMAKYLQKRFSIVRPG